MNEPERASWSRYLALDAHRQYLVAGGVEAHQTIVLKPVRVSFEEWPKWASANLHPTDALVLEATTNTWEVYDQVVPLVGRVVVAHPALVKLIASARVKTDPRDVLHLARLLAANLIPEVWVPPPAVRQLRALVNHRRHLVKHSTLTRNRLHSVLQRHNLPAPPGDPFSAKHRAWWHTLDLPAVEKLCLLHDLATLDHLAQQVGEAEAELMGFSVGEPWCHQVAFLVQLPGISTLSALTILAAVGEIERFETPKKLVGYAGLGAGVHASGQTHRGGHITKQGRKDLRWVMVWVTILSGKNATRNLLAASDGPAPSWPSRASPVCPTGQAPSGRLVCAHPARGRPAGGAQEGRFEAQVLGMESGDPATCGPHAEPVHPTAT